MKRIPPLAGAAAAAAVAALLAGLLARAEPARLPQALDGGDLLSVLLGDAKKDLSGAMIRQADRYFHGGLSDLHDGHAERSEGGTALARAHGHGHDDDGDDDEHEHEHGHGAAHAAPDPWRWIDRGIRAPDVHRHLDDAHAVELLPWFWLAARADPHDIEAWTSAWYAATHMIRDDALALRIALEGRDRNPDSIAMATVVGRAFLAEGVRDAEKSTAAFRGAVALARARDALSEDDSMAFFDAVAQLASAAAERGDARDLEDLLAAARRIDPDHPTAAFVARSLRETTAAP